MAKGPKNRQLKKVTYDNFRIRQYRCEKLLTYFRTIDPNKGELLFGYYNYFLQRKFYGQKPNFGKYLMGQKKFLTLSSNQSTAFIRHLARRSNAPSIIFSRTLAQMAALKVSQFLGPKSKKKKLTCCTGPYWQYRCENFPTRFSTIGPNKGELLFGYWLLFFTQKKLTVQKPNFGKSFSGSKTFS